MTLSKGANLSITAGAANESIAAFSSSQAGVVYGKPGGGATAAGFLLDISGTTVTKAGAQADLQTASTGVFQGLTLCPSSSTKLLLLGVDNNGTSAEVTVTAITKTATQLSGGTPNVLTFPGNVDNSNLNAMYPWDGEGLVIVAKSGFGAWYLTIADDSAQGNVVDFTPSPVPTIRIPAFAQLDTTSGIMVYQEATSSDFKGVKLTRTGSTLSAGSPFTLDTKNVGTNAGSLGAAIVDNSGRVIVGYIDTSTDKDLRTIDDTTDNTPLVIASSDAECWLERFHAGSAVVFADTGVTCDWEEVTIASNGTLTSTGTVAGSGTNNNNARGAMSRLDNSHIIAVFGGGSMNAAVLTTDVAPPAITSNQFTTAPMTSKPCDIDAGGTNIYIGAIASDTTPILIKFATALNVNGNVVFQPGAGDNIGVQCSRGDADEVTVAGQFDGTNVVERSEDAGSTFSVIDDTTIGGVASFIVGPDSDNRIMVFDEDNFDILETIDEGSSWTSNNASVSQVLRVLARLGIDVNQLIAGTSSADSAQVLHSPNAGAELEDIELDAFGLPNVDVNGILIN